MMHNSYDLHSWSKHYRQERLDEARRHQLEGRLREDGREHAGRGWEELTPGGIFSLLGAAALVVAGRVKP